MAADDLSAQVRRRSDNFLRPQIGLYFGPATPLFELQDTVNASLGGGVFVRGNTAWDLLKLGADVGYQKHDSDGVNSLSVVPMFANAVFLLPFRFPVHFQLKLGGGYARIWTEPDGKDQFDPLIVAGFEASFPAGRIINFGMRLDYMVLYEEHIDGAKYNGYILNSMLTMYFNL